MLVQAEGSCDLHEQTYARRCNKIDLGDIDDDRFVTPNGADPGLVMKASPEKMTAPSPALEPVVGSIQIGE